MLPGDQRQYQAQKAICTVTAPGPRSLMAPKGAGVYIYIYIYNLHLSYFRHYENLTYNLFVFFEREFNGSTLRAEV